MSAMYSMIPKVYAMMYNARFPWLKDQCVATHACPDGFNPVMFELIRKEPE
ncbi:MAG: TIGR04076 family protein [Candidatus Thorarchaeota archaeon]